MRYVEEKTDQPEYESGQEYDTVSDNSNNEEKENKEVDAKSEISSQNSLWKRTVRIDKFDADNDGV